VISPQTPVFVLDRQKLDMEMEGTECIEIDYIMINALKQGEDIVEELMHVKDWLVQREASSEEEVVRAKA